MEDKSISISNFISSVFFKLREHGFIVKENDHYRMRVPIFDTWLKQYGDYI